MFYTVASILITVVTLLFGVGYIVYKKIIQMIKNLDEKYECRLQIKLSEINTKFNETITEMEIRIKRLENTTDHNLEHTETLMIDLNNKNMITRNMLYDVKKEFARTTREYTTHYTNTSKDIKLLKDNYVTQEELNEAINNLGFIDKQEKHIGAPQCFVKCMHCTPQSLCINCYNDTTNIKTRGGLRIRDNFKKQFLKILHPGNLNICRIKKQFYYYYSSGSQNDQTNCSQLITFKSILLSDFIKHILTDIIEIPIINNNYNMNNYVEGCPNSKVLYAVGKIHNVTKEVTFY